MQVNIFFDAKVMLCFAIKLNKIYIPVYIIIIKTKFLYFKERGKYGKNQNQSYGLLRQTVILFGHAATIV